ncbi:unnamed protein product, partial [Scytosiphon promiscuus]
MPAGSSKRGRRGPALSPRATDQQRAMHGQGSTTGGVVSVPNDRAEDAAEHAPGLHDPPPVVSNAQDEPGSEDEESSGGEEASSGGEGEDEDEEDEDEDEDEEELQYCGACGQSFRGNQAFFACRICCQVYHPTCAGYNIRNHQQCPPPDWTCPHHVYGERGPSRCHKSFEGKGTVTLPGGNVLWCTVCFGDLMMNDRKMHPHKKCKRCHLNAHEECLVGRPVGPDGEWDCDECQRREEGALVSGDNLPWTHLMAGRKDNPRARVLRSKKRELTGAAAAEAATGGVGGRGRGSGGAERGARTKRPLDNPMPAHLEEEEEEAEAEVVVVE